jgi:flagellar basal body-associated protein FliL
MEELQSQTAAAPEKRSLGPIIGIIIILVILIIGGWLIYGRSIKNTIQPVTPAPNQAVKQSETQTMQEITTQSSSDAPDDISNDLQKVSPNNLDSGMESL